MGVVIAVLTAMVIFGAVKRVAYVSQ
ncbi:hypothetical protein [Robertmurraya mangrovi]